MVGNEHCLLFSNLMSKAVAHPGLSYSSLLSFRVPFRVRSDIKTLFQSLNSYPVPHPRTNRLPISFVLPSLSLFLFRLSPSPLSPPPSAYTHATTTYMCWSRRQQHCLSFRSSSASYRLPPPSYRLTAHQLPLTRPHPTFSTAGLGLYSASTCDRTR